MKEHNYYSAALEFQIAIELMPSAQGTSAYYANLAHAYEKLGMEKEILPCLEKAVKLNPFYFDYYLRTAEQYKKLGIIDDKLAEYKNKKGNPLNRIMIGLLYIQKGEEEKGITILDNFCCEEENLIISAGVREYINRNTKSGKNISDRSKNLKTSP